MSKRNPYAIPAPPRPVPATVPETPRRDPAATGFGDGDARPARGSRRRVPALALDMAEACDALGVADSTLRGLIRDGTVPALQVGRRWMIPVDALRRRLSELATEAANQRGRRGAADAADGRFAPEAGEAEGGRTW